MTGKTYPKAFDRYWKRCIHGRDKNPLGVPFSTKSDLKQMLFNAYRAGVRHTNGEHDRARYRHRLRNRKRSWV